METLKGSRLMEMLETSKGKVKVKEERVLNYLLAHEDEIQDLSIAQIAEEADVSKATVVRFCKTLDFTGLKDFKVWYEAGKGSRYVDVEPVTSKDDAEKVLMNLSSSIVRTMEKTFDKENKDKFDAVVSDIESASSIIISGVNEAEAYGKLLCDVLKKFAPEKTIILNPTSGETAELCLAISITGMEKETMDTISNIVFAGGKADVIATSQSSLIAKVATNSIWVVDDPYFSLDEHMMGKLAIHAVIDYIAVMLGKGRL